MLEKLVFKSKKFIAQRLINFSSYETGKSIQLERQRRALASTVDYVERHMRHVDSVTSRFELLANAFNRADLSGNKLICEFGVCRADSLNHIAKMTAGPVFGFDSFEGLPERWTDGFKVGSFAVAKLPEVEKNVTLIKGWFNKSLPEFLTDHKGAVGFLHIDSDLYSSAKTIFELLEPRLKSGAVIVFDEYFNYPEWQEGEYKAFMEFLEKTSLSFEFIGYNRNEEQVAIILREKKSC